MPLISTQGDEGAYAGTEATLPDALDTGRRTAVHRTTGLALSDMGRTISLSTRFVVGKSVGDEAGIRSQSMRQKT